MSQVAMLQQQQVGRRIVPDTGILWFSPLEIAQVIGCRVDAVETYWPPIASLLRERGIADRACSIAVLATIGVEVGSFRPIHEFGGVDYFTRMYEGRADLGNIFPGDGARFHGRGFIQLTGRANYRTYGAKLGVPLEADPDLALEPDVAGAVLIQYFVDRGIPLMAALGDWRSVRIAVNGGLNGWDRFSGLVRDFEALGGPRSLRSAERPTSTRGRSRSSASRPKSEAGGSDPAGPRKRRRSPAGTSGRKRGASNGQSKP